MFDEGALPKGARFLFELALFERVPAFQLVLINTGKNGAVGSQKLYGLQAILAVEYERAFAGNRSGREHGAVGRQFLHALQVRLLNTIILLP